MATPSTATPSKLEAQLTGKAKQLEEDHAKGMSEAERLREEVNRTRAMRANRAANRSQKSISNMGDVTSPPPPSSLSPLTSPPLGSIAASRSSSHQEGHTTTIGTGSGSGTGSTIHVDPNTRIKHHASSFPVFTGRIASSSPSQAASSPSISSTTSTRTGGGTSLANFIGGDTRIKGPILNKVRPYEEESLLSKEERTTPQATFLARNPGLLPRHQHYQQASDGDKSGVALPGMVRAATPSPSLSTSNPKPHSYSPSAAFGQVEKSATDPTPTRTGVASSIIIKSPLLGATSSNNAEPIYNRNISRSPVPMDRLSLHDEKTSSAQPEVGSKSPSSSMGTPTAAGAPAPKSLDVSLTNSNHNNNYAQTTNESATKVAEDSEDMTSLGRLRGASIVKQRLAWGEAKKESTTHASTFTSTSTRYTPTNSPKPPSGSSFGNRTSSSSMDTSSSSPIIHARSSSFSKSPVLPSSSPNLEQGNAVTTGTPIQTKRSSVLDRWNRDTPNQFNSATNSAFASASPVASPKVDNQPSKWPKPAYGRPDITKKPSWSSTSGSGSASGVKPASSPRLDSPASHGADQPGPQEKEKSLVNEEHHSTSATEKLERSPAESSVVDSKPEVTITEEPKTFQRPSTKPPWMAKDSSLSSSPSSSQSTEPTRSSTYPRPQISTSNLGSRSPIPSPKPASASSSRSMPSSSSPSLPISVSPAPYVRSSQNSQTGQLSPRNSVFQPSATSFPVSLGVAPTHARPLSLAHFIGGDRHVNGPVLNKVRPEEFDGYGLENDATANKSPNAKVGSFLTHNPNVMNEMMKKQQQQQHRVPMPGMVPPSSATTSPQPPSQHSPSTWQSNTLAGPTSHAMEKKSSTGPLPLPGMESPKLPLPGQELSPPLPVAELQEHNEDSNQGPKDGGDRTMSKLLKEGYETVHSIDTVQPSESNALSGESARPSARTLSHEFEKHHRDHPSPIISATAGTNPPQLEEKKLVTTISPISPLSEDNPWAAIGSAMLDSGIETPKEEKNRHRSAPSWEGTLKTLGKGPARHAPRPPGRQESQEVPKTPSDPVIARRAAIRVEDLPSPDVSQLAMPSTSRLTFQQYVSVDVLSITDDAKTTAIPPSEQSIFYSTELLAVVLRSKQGGLVTTDLIVWKGKHCSEDGREKVQELEKRYGTTAMYVEQGKESLHLVKALGGRLISRQGFRGTFDVLNSTLYRVQSRGRGLTFVDEVDLQASSLCSAYSYIASVFQDLFVWYGRGTPDEESRVAVQYAEELAKAGPGAKRKVAHMLEGAESDLWSDIMGHEEEYAFANHWRFRLDSAAVAQSVTQFYEVNVSTNASLVRALGDETACSLSDRGVYIVRTPLECFVVVTPPARGNSRRIAAALQAAAAILKRHPIPQLPHRPTLHALVLPSLIPRDLQASLRSTVLEDLNSPFQPCTMNVIEEQTAWEHLGRDAFYKSEILDEALLPLGVSPEMLQ